MEQLINSKNGITVLFDPISSHAATHMADSPNLKQLVMQIIQQTELTGALIEFDTDFKTVVGKSDLVKNDENDEIIYAKRKNRDVYTSFNKSKGPEPCTLVAVSLRRINNQSYELVSTWIGSLNSPAFPGEKNETSDSKDYWQKHSLAWGTQEIQHQTITKICPW